MTGRTMMTINFNYYENVNCGHCLRYYTFRYVENMMSIQSEKKGLAKASYIMYTWCYV